MWMQILFEHWGNFKGETKTGINYNSPPTDFFPLVFNHHTYLFLTGMWIYGLISCVCVGGGGGGGGMEKKGEPLIYSIALVRALFLANVLHQCH